MSARFLQRLAELQALVIVQRAVRILLRGAWLLAGINLACWGLDRLAGWKLQAIFQSWGMLAGAALLLAAMIFPLPNRKRLAWRLDRRLGLQEQISTALEVSRQGEPEGVEQLLVNDAARLLRNAFQRVFLRGWNLAPDLIAGLMVLVLTVMVAQTRQFPAGLALPPVTRAVLPPATRDPGAEEIFPSGIPGLRGLSGAPDIAQQLTADELTDIQQNLSELGNELAQQAATYELGKALEENRMEDAARRVEELAGRLSGLSAASREELAASLQKAADALAGRSNPLAETMAEAAESLARNRARDSVEQLQQLARDLRNFSRSQLASARPAPGASIGPEGGGGITGASEPFERLQGGQGEEIQLAENHPFLSPAQPSESSGETLAAPLNQPRSENAPGEGLYLIPYHYPWTWRDVVSQYFSR